MHVVGKMKNSVLRQAQEERAGADGGATPLTFFKTRPVKAFGH
jgi:hypothetical protein